MGRVLWGIGLDSFQQRSPFSLSGCPTGKWTPLQVQDRHDVNADGEAGRHKDRLRSGWRHREARARPGPQRGKTGANPEVLGRRSCTASRVVFTAVADIYARFRGLVGSFRTVLSTCWLLQAQWKRSVSLSMVMRFMKVSRYLVNRELAMPRRRR